MSRAVWFHCYAGIAGDMALASLLDAGGDIDSVNRGLSSLGVPGLVVNVETVSRCGLAATKIEVSPAPGEASLSDGASRTHADIVALIGQADLPARVRSRATAVFDALAGTEGQLHGTPMHAVHFHEVGGHDALADIVGTCLALESLGIDDVYSSPVSLGRGTVRSAHGTLPNPAPATLRLLASVPVVGTDLEVELTTPTGAALLAGLGCVFGPLPSMVVESSGYGAGSREFDHMPNCVQAVIGSSLQDESQAAYGPGDSVGQGLAYGTGQLLDVIEANLDDTTGEILSYTIAQLMEAGALDAWVTATTGKKGRPAHTVTVLSDPEFTVNLANVLAIESGTLGVRRWPVSRWAEKRTVEHVVVDGTTVRVKLSGNTVKAEYEDVVAIARATGAPLREVARRAEEAWRAH